MDAPSLQIPRINRRSDFYIVLHHLYILNGVE